MIKLFILYLLIFLAYELNFFPININDIVGIALGIYGFIIFLFNKKAFANIHTYSFLNKDFQYIVYSGLLIIFFYFIFSNESIFNAAIRMIRILYFFISLFTSIYIINESIIFADKKSQNLSKLIRIIVLSNFIVLSISILNSIIGECRIQYGGSFCFLNQTNYSANGYIPVALFFINIILLRIIENYNIRFNNLKYIKSIIIFNLISSLIITSTSGSRGALSTLIITLVSLFYRNIKSVFSLRFSKFTFVFLLIIIVIYNTEILKNLDLRTISYVINPDLGSDRFGLHMFKKGSILLGSGNFNFGSPFSAANFDGTLRLFTISYGLIGLMFFLFLVYFFIKKLFFLRNKLIMTNNYGSIDILYSTFIYTVFFSFANENIIINGNSIIFLFSVIMPLMFLDYISNKIRIRDCKIP